MSLVNSSIPNLMNGVSQQPYALRLPSQCEEQINALASVVEGLRKRPPSRFQFLIEDDKFTSSTVLDHTIVRDGAEQYKVLIGSGQIKVLNLLTKEVVPVSYPDGRSYLNCSSPYRHLRAVTIADHTFILNRTVTTRASPQQVTKYRPEALVWVRAGAYGCKYRVSLNGHRVIWTTPDGTNNAIAVPPLEEGDLPDTITSTYNPTPPIVDTNDKLLPQHIATDSIAASLRDLLKRHPKLNGKFTIDIKGSVLRIRSNAVTSSDGSKSYPDFKVYGSDSQGDTVLRVLKDKTKSMTDLPARCFNSFRIKIMGDSSTQFDDYYVRYEGDISAGTWVEDRSDEETYLLASSTMPHALIRQSDGTFSFKKLGWDGRKVGDSKSNPMPSFVDRRLGDLFFYGNRLGFIAEDKVVFSRFGNFYSFFKASATQVLDTDPIDIAVSHTKVVDLTHAISYQDNLLLFGDGVQFQLREAETLTTKTVGFAQTTEYACSTAVRPVPIGDNLYFTHDRGENRAVIREYNIVKGETSGKAEDITAHVPTYLQSRVVAMAGSDTENILVCTGASQKNVVYVYKYFWAGTEKLQSSWSKWVFEAGTDILGMSFIGSTLWLTIIRGDVLTVESMDLAPSVTIPGQDFDVHLDRRFSHEDVVAWYDPERDETRIRSPYGVDWPVTIVAAPTNEAYGFAEGQIVPHTSDRRSFVIQGRLEKYYVGAPYTTSYKFSTLTIKQESGAGEAKSIIDGRLQLRKMVLQYANSGYFRVQVTPVKREPYIYPFTAKTLGIFRQKIGRVNIESGTFQFPIMSKNDQVTIEIINDNWLPFSILSAEWEGLYTTRSRRL